MSEKHYQTLTRNGYAEKNFTYFATATYSSKTENNRLFSLWEKPNLIFNEVALVKKNQTTSQTHTL